MIYLFEMIKENAAIIIAGLALLLTVLQGWQNHRHNKLSVKPMLGFERHDNKIDNLCHYKFVFVNSGVGPAIIKTFILVSDDTKKLYDNFEDYSDFVFGMIKGFTDYNQTHLGSNSSMDNKEKKILWEVTYDPNSKKDIDILNAIEKFWVFVEYQSIYEDEVFTLNEQRYKKFKDERLLLAQIMAKMHALCLPIPRPWTEQEFFDLIVGVNIFHMIHKYGFVMGQVLDAEQVVLLNLVVIPNEQGKCIGRSLLNDFIAEAKEKGRQSIFLEVAENNAPALHLFEKTGFKRTDLPPASYEAPNAPNIDAILMRLDI